MNVTSKETVRPPSSLLQKTAGSYLLVSAGAAVVGAVYAGLCGGVLGFARGTCWNAAAAGLRGGSAGLAAGVLTATFGIWMSGRVALLPIFSQQKRRNMDFSFRRGRPTGRPFVLTRARSGMDP